MTSTLAVKTIITKLKLIIFLIFNTVVISAYCAENNTEDNKLIVREPITLIIDEESVPSMLESQTLIPIYNSSIKSEGSLYYDENGPSIPPKIELSGYQLTLTSNEFSNIGVQCNRTHNTFNMKTFGTEDNFAWPESVPEIYNYDQIVQMYLKGEMLFGIKPTVNNGGKYIRTQAKTYKNSLSISHSRGPIDIKSSKMEFDRSLFTTPTGIYIDAPEEMVLPFIQSIKIFPKIYYYFTGDNVIHQSRTVLLDGNINFGSGKINLLCCDVGKIEIEFSPSLLETEINKPCLGSVASITVDML